MKPIAAVDTAASAAMYVPGVCVCVRVQACARPYVCMWLICVKHHLLLVRRMLPPSVPMGRDRSATAGGAMSASLPGTTMNGDGISGEVTSSDSEDSDAEAPGVRTLKHVQRSF